MVLFHDGRGYSYYSSLTGFMKVHRRLGIDISQDLVKTWIFSGLRVEPFWVKDGLKPSTDQVNRMNDLDLWTLLKNMLVKLDNFPK